MLFIGVICASACTKKFQPSEVSGTWNSIHEDWTITNNGKEAKESYDYGSAPSEQSAVLRLIDPSFDVMTGSNTWTKTFNMVYSDRFSPVDEKTSARRTIQMSVVYRKRSITVGDASWVVSSLKGDRMELDYDSGETESDGAVIRRKCRYVFLKQRNKR